MPKRNLVYKGNGQDEKLGKYSEIAAVYIFWDMGGRTYLQRIEEQICSRSDNNKRAIRD